MDWKNKEWHKITIKKIIILTIAFNRERSVSVTKVTAHPSFPALAVRPTR